jgi:hypothetical protein
MVPDSFVVLGAACPFKMEIISTARNSLSGGHFSMTQPGEGGVEVPEPVSNLPHPWLLCET